MIVARGEGDVRALVHRRRGSNVEYHQFLDGLDMVHGHAVRHPPAAVVTNHAELVEAKALHKGNLVLGHLTL